MMKGVVSPLPLMAMIAIFMLPSSYAEKIYRTVNPDGSISYSDIEPKGGKTEAIPMPKMINLQPLDEHSKQQISDYKTRRDERGRQQGDQKELVNEAKKALAEAKQALTEGAEAGEGDRQNTRKGSKLSQDYFDRISKLEDDIKRAEQSLREAREGKSNNEEPNPLH